jgi:hypothetical protein
MSRCIHWLYNTSNLNCALERKSDLTGTVTCMSDYRRGLDWWLDLLHTLIQLTTLYSSLSHTHTHTHTHTLVSTVTSSQPLFGIGYRRRTFPLLWVPELFLCLNYQRLTATAHNDWTTAALWLLTNQLTSLHCTLLHCIHETQSVGRSSDIASERAYRNRRFQQYFHCYAQAAA